MNPNPQAVPEPGFKDLNLPAVGLCLLVFFILIFVGTVAGRLIGLRNRARDMRRIAELAHVKCNEMIARLTANASFPSPLIAHLQTHAGYDRLPEFLELLRKSGETDLAVAAQQLEECAAVESDAVRDGLAAQKEFERVCDGWPGSFLSKMIKFDVISELTQTK